MFDEYGIKHTGTFEQIINIYNNYSEERIFQIIKTYVTEDLSNESEYIEEKILQLTKHVYSKIKFLRKNLDVLDKQDITTIGSRIINNKFSTFNYELEINVYAYTLIQVWRGSDPEKIEFNN